MAKRYSNDCDCTTETETETETEEISSNLMIHLPNTMTRTRIDDPLNLLQYKIDISTISSKPDQNNLIDSFLIPRDSGPILAESQSSSYQIAMYGSFIANLGLFSMQLTAAIMSQSLSLFATTLDSFMDVVSSLVLVYTGKLADSVNYITYPAGKGKYKTAGIIVFSTLMMTLSLQILSESIQSLIGTPKKPKIEFLQIVLVLCGIGVKLILALYCNLFKNQFTSVAILAQDHMNDVLCNSAGLLFSFLATKYETWIDPVGAMLISFYIMHSWSKTALDNIQNIVGVAADSAFLNKVTYIALTHDPRIDKVDTVNAYHSGDTLFVEVDIILNPQMTLLEAHDIGEALQTKLEDLQRVDRAFVHLDYEGNHVPEHRKPLALA